MRSSQAGFTLIEIIVVMVVVGLMVAVIPPRLNGTLEKMKGKAAMRETISALRQTRNLAISSGKTARLVINIANNTLKIDDQTAKTLSKTIRLGLLTARSEQLSEQAGAVRFYPDGSSTGGRIKFAAGKQNYFVEINWLTGKVALIDQIDPDNWNTTDQNPTITNLARYE